MANLEAASELLFPQLVHSLGMVNSYINKDSTEALEIATALCKQAIKICEEYLLPRADELTNRESIMALYRYGNTLLEILNNPTEKIRTLQERKELSDMLRQFEMQTPNI